jgi:hypothetical protein
MKFLSAALAVSLSLVATTTFAGQSAATSSGRTIPIKTSKAGGQPIKVSLASRPVAHTERGNAVIARAYAKRKTSTQVGTLSIGGCMPEEDDPLCDPWQEPEVEFVEFDFEYVDYSGAERVTDFALERVVIDGERPYCSIAVGGVWMDLENCSLASTPPGGPLGDFSPASKNFLETLVDKFVSAPDIKLKRCVRIIAQTTLDFDASVDYAIALGNFLTVYQGETSNIYVATVDVKYLTGSTQTFYVLKNWRGNLSLSAPTPAKAGNTCD